jgi:hypothetical protein
MKKKSKMKYCCETLKDEIENGCPLPLTHRRPIFYDAVRRSYGIIMEEDETKMDEEDPGLYKSYISMQYCPFCGAEFPSDLGEKWSDVIWEELGPEYLIESRAAFQKLLCKHQGKEYIPDPDLPKAKPLPKEFKTDEWWKKRGL